MKLLSRWYIVNGWVYVSLLQLHSYGLSIYRYRRVKRSECGLRCFRGFGAYVILVSRETNIGAQSEISEIWPLKVSRVSHSFSALSESRLWGSNLRVDAYMHNPNSIFFIKNWIKQINSQKYYSIFSYFMFVFTDFSVFLSLRFRVIELIYLLSPRKLEVLFNHFPKLRWYFYLRTIFFILYIYKSLTPWIFTDFYLL